MLKLYWNKFNFISSVETLNEIFFLNIEFIYSISQIQKNWIYSFRELKIICSIFAIKFYTWS